MTDNLWSSDFLSNWIKKRWILWREKNQGTRRTTYGARTRTNNKPDPHMAAVMVLKSNPGHIGGRQVLFPATSIYGLLHTRWKNLTTLRYKETSGERKATILLFFFFIFFFSRVTRSRHTARINNDKSALNRCRMQCVHIFFMSRPQNPTFFIPSFSYIVVFNLCSAKK